ncbi:MAG TPA: pantoate--beta-alanine ligase [Fimbriimonadaceae bacterium]|nr:pantoate--beta-alanine ligase [Fimbriimonadaceae bacterium]HRJ95218.1 pantoate--beta-alanine ligase [Fimbriimonadaceae bacterium]
MKVIRTISALRAADLPSPIGCVPTMGAFHEGHLELMRQARKECASVVVTLFVNPTQFGPSEDLSRYPRQEKVDAHLAESAGVDLLFAPSSEEIFPRRTTKVCVEEVSSRWEGPLRPGHFEGVATVVLKLFNIVRPDVAYFGLKDLQQCAVVRRMVEDLDVPISLRFLETVRDSDGLALSSRNAYLSPQARAIAPQIFRSIVLAAQAIGEQQDVDLAIGRAVAALTERGIAVEYLSLVDPITMNPLDRLSPGCRLVVAARLDGVRLLDNVGIEPGANAKVS